MNGTADQRAGAALIVASRRQPENLTVLAALARDSDPWVRAVVANQLTDWIRDDVAADSASALLQRDSDGTLVARMVAVRLDGSSRTAATDRIAVQLEDPASAYVRTQVAAHRSKAAGSKETTYETCQTSTRRVGMCQVGASRKFVSEEAVAILRHRVFAKRVLLAAFRHRAEKWGCREAPASLKK